MKKNVLSLSITAALVGFGFAGGAQAIGLDNPSATPIPPGAATSLRTSLDGVGHFLYVPYYTAQGANNTMINIVNTDSVNGKAVKVRFRGAANSDDVFDFQVFLSPNDVWTASVTKNANGETMLNTQDLSCTKPDKAQLNTTAFQTFRLDKLRTGDALLNEAREGYVEIFNMADIPPTNGAVTNALYTATTHVKGSPNTAPPCRTTPTTAAWTALEIDPLDTAAANAKGLYAPTTGLFANWIILNATDAGAWSGAATAIAAVGLTGLPTTGAITYFPQTNQGLGVNATASRISLFTADPWLRANPSRAATYDLPDFSIPYTSSSDPTVQVSNLSGAIATRNIMNEFLTVSAINASTDWLLSMPTRRYSVAYDYNAKTVLYTVLPVQYFTPTNTTVIDRQVCITGTSITVFDQEETTPTTPGAGVIISPQEPGKPTSFNICGEASVLSFNRGESASASGLITSASGTFKATVARSAVDGPYAAGWANLATPGLSNGGLPILGYEAVRATSGAQSFGATLVHRTTRVQP